MKKRAVIRRILWALLLILPLLLSGCWGGREIDALFIVTGVALDASDDPEKMNITFQVAKIEAMSGGDSGGSSSSDSSTILLKTEQPSVTDAIADFNRNSSRKIFLQHNQVILIGSELAEKGIIDAIDLFVRDQEARLEVPIVVVDGEAGEALAVEMPQKKISGEFLGRMLERQSTVSILYRTRLIDFTASLLEQSSSSVVPMVEVVEEDGEKLLKLTGMAVFKEGRMIGTLSNEEAQGFVFGMGSVSSSSITAKCDAGQASFLVSSLNARQKLNLRPDGGFSLNISVNAVLTANELYGFDGMDAPTLVNHLMELSQNTLKDSIKGAFQKAQELRADIYGTGLAAHRQYPKKWREVSKDWDEYFADMDLAVEVHVTLPNTGKVVESLNTEEHDHGN